MRADETLNTLSGYAAWIASAEPDLGHNYLTRIERLQVQQETPA
ncbi:hypothetical protein ACOBWA_07340 [Psychrobacter sp. ER1]